MPPLPNLLLSNAIMASLLALVAAGVTYFFRRPALSHGLWLLVLLKLLTPPIIPLQISWPVKENAPATTDTQTSLESAVSSNGEPAGIPTSQPDDAVTTILIYPAEPESSIAGSDSAVATESNTMLPTNFWSYLSEKVLALWPGLLAPIWLAGSIFWLGRTGLHVYRFERVLRYAQPAPNSLQNEVRDWAAQFGLRKCPTLWLVPGCVSPMLWTVGRAPRLLFPAKLLDRLDSDQRSALLVHELAHLRRRDHWVRLIEMAAMAIYWWHPIVWWARRELHEAEEQCCDAWVVWALTSGGEPVCGRPGCVSARRRAYALALLHTVDFFSHARPTLPAPASGVGQVPHLRRRLTMIMNGNTPKSLSSAGRLAVLAIGLLLPLVPVQAQQPQDPKDDRDQQIEKLKKVLQALEQQKHAEQAVQEAQVFQREREFDLKRVAEQRNRLKQAKEVEMAQRELDLVKKAKAKADEQQAIAVRFLQEAELAQNQDPEQRRHEIRLRNVNVDVKASPDVQKAMHAIEEITKMVEMKRRELTILEEKLQHAHADLEHMRAEGARGEAQRRIERKVPDGAPAREPIILRIDPSANPEQIMKQVQEIQSKSQRPIRVEIENPETGRAREVEIVRPEPGPVNIRNRAEPAPAEVRFRLRETKDPQGSNLEEKLERIMKEVEELRRELHDSRNKK